MTFEQTVKAAQNAPSVTKAPTSTQLVDAVTFLAQKVILGARSVTVGAGNATVLQTEETGRDDQKGENDEGDEVSNVTGKITKVAENSVSDEGEHKSLGEVKEVKVS